MRKLRIILVWRLLTARRSLYQEMVIVIQQNIVQLTGTAWQKYLGKQTILIW